jgi:hypothetical protein
MQPSTEYITRKVLTSSANNKKLEYSITLQRSLINTLKIKGPETDPCGTREIASKDNEKYLKCVHTIAD